MIAYKLTHADLTTYGGTQWVPGEWQETSGEGELCGPGWLHFYTDPLVAVFLDPIYGNFGPTARSWEAETKGRILDDRGLKLGATRMRLVRELPLPRVTLTQRVAFAILCAREVCTEPTWPAWSEAWLSGQDRSEEAARAAAARAPLMAAWAAAWAAAVAPTMAAAATGAAAGAVEDAATGAAAGAAAGAAEAAAKPLDLPALARRAMEVTP